MYEPIIDHPLSEQMERYVYKTKHHDASPVLVETDFLNASEINSTFDSISREFELAKLTAGRDRHVENLAIRSVQLAKKVDFSIINDKLETIVEKIHDYWDVDHPVQKLHEWQGLTYRVGGHYKYHSDNGVVRNGQWKVIYPKRSFSIVVFLTDWSHDKVDDRKFTGGELLFTHLVDMSTNQRFCVYPRAGTLVIFQSSPVHMHQVNPVRDGRRACLVNWFGDPSR